MLNLQSPKANRSSRGRNYVKQSLCSFNKFQDFLVTKSKQKTSKAFFVDRQSMTSQIKIQKLNFSKTTSENQFLPPRSIDKFCKSSTNRGGFSLSKQEMMMSQTQTPIQKTKILSFESTNEDYLPRPHQIKAKIESNAMQRFQQLFKKQTNIRAKKIQEEQSKRLMQLLEKTSRNNQAHSNNGRNSGQQQNGYLNYGNPSKKKFSRQENNLTESTNLQRQLDEQSDHKIKARQNIKNPRILQTSQMNQTIDREPVSKQTNNLNKQGSRVQSKKNSFFQDRNSVDLGKELKKTITIDDSKKNTQIPKQEPRKASLPLKRKQSYADETKSEVNQKLEREKVQEQVKKSQQRESKMQAQLKESKKEQINKKQQNKTHQAESKKLQFQRNQLKQPQQKKAKQNVEQSRSKTSETPKNKHEQLSKNNSFKVDQIDVLDLLPTAEIIQKIQPSTNQVPKDKAKPAENLEKQKNQVLKCKVSLQELMKSKNNVNQYTQQSVASQSQKPKAPITIKGAKQVKSTKNEPQTQKSSQRFDPGNDDFDDLEEVQIDQKGTTKKVEEDKKPTQTNKSITQGNNLPNQNNSQKGSIKPGPQGSNQNIKPSTSTSLANQIQNNKNDSKQSQNQQQKTNHQNLSTSKLQPSTPQIKQKQPISQPESQEKVEFNDSSQGQACPADELCQLLDLVQTLGSYYTDSKHFYSQPDSSMVQIIMNHKLASYFLAQQYFFYISLFQKCATASQIQDFYSLSAEEFAEALQDEEMAEGIEDLKRSSELAVKLIKMTHEKCKAYLKKHQRDLTISPELNYHKQCLEHLRAEFSGLYKLYQEKTTSPLGKRLCYLIETYCLVMLLNQEQIKEYEDVEDFEPQIYAKHINNYKHLMGV